ncbi:MAG: Na+/H+ antiporter NhaA [Pirellulaceae bacterium]
MSPKAAEHLHPHQKSFSSVAKHQPLPDDENPLPKEPVDRVIRPIVRFMHVEAASGVVLLICTIVALVLANSPWGEGFLHFFEIEIGFEIEGVLKMQHSLHHWINDALMTVFFFVVGLEVKRELVVGELRDPRGAVLPVAAALGGMVVPAGIYLALQYGQPGESGWGIPMATDIAFVVGCMAILGRRVPNGLRVMLLSLAIADDIGAIIVIAVGYTEDLQWSWLLAGGVGIGVVSLMARIGVRSFFAYVTAGVFIWIAFHESKVHATLAGVILGLMTPARTYIDQNIFSQLLRRAESVMQGDWESMPHRAEAVSRFRHAVRETISPLEYLEGILHPWTSFVIMPIFALANAGVAIHLEELGSGVGLAVAVGLVVGKPLGILLFSWLAVATRLAKLPEGVNWGLLAGGGCLAGIGFTMALFIAGLAVEGDLLDSAKIGVLAGSLLSAALGMGLLLAFGKKQAAATSRS